jgi:hypothetical protein
MKGLTILLLVFLSFTSQAQDPEWIYGKGHDEYRNSRYLTALGEGRSAEDARKNAYSTLAEQLQVNISSESSIVKEYRSVQDQFTQQESADIRIQTQVNLDNIEGIKIVSRYHKPSSNRYYAFAVLDKTKNANDLGGRIESLISAIRGKISGGKSEVSGGRAAQGVTMLVQAANDVEQLVQDVDLHRLFADSASNTRLRKNSLELIGDVDKALGEVLPQVYIQVNNGNSKQGSPELGVPEAFSLTFAHGGYALGPVPVRVETDMQSAIIDVDKTSGLDGNVSVRVRSMPYTGKAENRLRVKLDFNDQLFTNKSPYTDLTVLLSQKSEVSVVLNTDVKSNSHSYLDVVVNENLASILSEQNYHVLSDGGGVADYIIEVRASVSELPGFSGMAFTKIGGVIMIKSGKTNRRLKTIKINKEATKAGALDHETASEKSAQLLGQAVREDLLETLEKNLGRN